MNESFRLRFYSVRANLLGSKLTIADRTGTDIFFVPIKNVGHCSEVNVFPDKKTKEPVLVVRPVYPEGGKGWLRKLKDFVSGPTHHNVIDPKTAEKVGAVRLETSTRIPKDQKWLLMDATDRDLGRLEPLSSRTWGAKFEHSGLIGNREVFLVKSRNTIAGRSIDFDLSPDIDGELDARLVIAAAIKMAVDMVNLASE